VLHGDQFEVLGSGKVTITEAGHQQYFNFVWQPLQPEKTKVNVT
jgi:hypothetical protein